MKDLLIPVSKEDEILPRWREMLVGLIRPPENGLREIRIVNHRSHVANRCP